MLSLSKKLAFTLAEILVTLGVIGVIAAITIPLISNYFETQLYKTEYKKAYSDLLNAARAAHGENLLTSIPTSGNQTIAFNNFNAIKSKMMVSKDCGQDASTPIAKGCWVDSTYSDIGELTGDPRPAAWYPSYKDSKGRNWTMLTTGTMRYLVDTNGDALPNVYGKDRWVLDLSTSPTSSIYAFDTGASIIIPPWYDMTTNQNWGCPNGATIPCYYVTYLKSQ